MEDSGIMTYLRRMTWFEKFMWRMHIFFGYQVYKSTFGIAMAKEWKREMLGIIEETPCIIWDD